MTRRSLSALIAATFAPRKTAAKAVPKPVGFRAGGENFTATLDVDEYGCVIGCTFVGEMSRDEFRVRYPDYRLPPDAPIQIKRVELPVQFPSSPPS